MPGLKAAMRRAAEALTGHTETRAAVAKLASRLDAAASSSRETGQRLKTTTQITSDRVLALQRDSVSDRKAILDAIAGLLEEQKVIRKELAALSRLTQRLYVDLIDAEPFAAAALDHAALVAHIRRRVLSAPMRTEPFPHLVVSELLPADFYQQLLRAIPAPTFWRRAGHQRDNWHVEEDSASRLSETTWRFMHREIAARELMPLLLDRFSDAIAAYWRDTLGLDASEFAGHYLCDEGRLLLRHPGYELEPHLDPPHAILTVLFYLAQPGAADAHGTDLYASDPLPAERAGILYPARQGIKVERVTTIPFRPNTALVFVTPRSVHGAKLPSTVDEHFERVSYQFLACLDEYARRVVRKQVGQQPASVAQLY
jgi:hypothetical protein